MANWMCADVWFQWSSSGLLCWYSFYSDIIAELPTVGPVPNTTVNKATVLYMTSSVSPLTPAPFVIAPATNYHVSHFPFGTSIENWKKKYLPLAAKIHALC